MRTRSDTILHDPLPICPRLPIGQIPPQLDMDYNARKAPIGGEFLRLLQLAAWRRGGAKLTSRILILLTYCL
jgi:hypothetical protein